MKLPKPKKPKKWKRIITGDDPVLRQIAAPADLEFIANEAPRLINDMLWLMQSKQGSGLAAPQVGCSTRIIVMNHGERVAMINPEIIKHSDEEPNPKREGCLSFPGDFRMVPRYYGVTVSFTTVTGRLLTRSYHGFVAQCVQHEIDHLDGKILIDHRPMPPHNPQKVATIVAASVGMMYAGGVTPPQLKR